MHSFQGEWATTPFLLAEGSGIRLTQFSTTERKGRLQIAPRRGLEIIRRRKDYSIPISFRMRARIYDTINANLVCSKLLPKVFGEYLGGGILYVLAPIMLHRFADCLNKCMQEKHPIAPYCGLRSVSAQRRKTIAFARPERD